jgi:hypothetical protein
MALGPESNEPGYGEAPINERRRSQKFANASPLEAAAAWLRGNFAIYDEPAMVEAIRRDYRITLIDADIVEFFFGVMGESGWDPQLCLDTLAKRSEELKARPSN